MPGSSMALMRLSGCEPRGFALAHGFGQGPEAVSGLIGLTLLPPRYGLAMR